MYITERDKTEEKRIIFCLLTAHECKLKILFQATKIFKNIHLNLSFQSAKLSI